MGYDRHLFRRGSVWQWRRRICRLSTGSCILQVSLRTTDRRQAVKLARMMSVECDRMLDDNDPKSLSQADLAKWMREVVAHTVERQSRARTVRKMDAGATSTDDELWDQATVRAWGLLDKHGVNARVPANVDNAQPLFTEEEEHATRVILTSLAAKLQTEGHQQKCRVVRTGDRPTGLLRPSRYLAAAGLYQGYGSCLPRPART